MHSKVSEVGSWLRSVVRGWLNYHAVPGNINCLDEFCTQVERLWLRILRRRSQKGRAWTWDAVSPFGAAMDTQSPNPSSLS